MVVVVLGGELLVGGAVERCGGGQGGGGGEAVAGGGRHGRRTALDRWRWSGEAGEEESKRRRGIVGAPDKGTDRVWCGEALY